MKRRVIGLLALLVAVALVGCGSPKITKTYKPDPEEPGIPVNAGDLAEAFATDPEAAKQKYVGKPVEAEGVIRSVSNSPLSKAQVLLEGKPGGKAVECVFYMASEIDVSEGQAVTIRGRCDQDGKLIGAYVKKAGPDPVKKVTAAQLAKEYAADAKAAGQKYDGKVLLVEGTVRDVQTREGRKVFIFEGANEGTPQAVHVVADVSPKMGMDKLVGSVKKGEKWSFRGKPKGLDKGEVFFPRPFLHPQPEE